jgi:Asp-tRNA(Asn)/Glu-tRNA(Gln) amidotransferase C subunit
MLHLKSLNVEEHELKVVYEAVHSRNGRTLTEDIIVQQLRHNGQAKASLSLKNCEAKSVEDALDRMANWCERIASAIRGRGENSVAALQFVAPVREDDVETERLEKLIFSIHESGSLTLEMVKAACPPKRGVYGFWDRSHSIKATDGRDMADIVIALVRPEIHEKIRELEKLDEDSAYDLKKHTYFEVAKEVLGWT